MGNSTIGLTDYQQKAVNLLGLGTPSTNDSLTNKKYVDDMKSTVKGIIDSLNDVIS